MQKSKIFFIELNTEAKFKHACDIIENLYESNVSVTVFVRDGKFASLLDRQLWTWKQESFVPHIILNNYTHQPDEPVLITTNESFPAETDALFFYDPPSSAPIDRYKYVIDFAELYNPEKRRQSRERFKKLRDTGKYEIEFTKLGAFLKKFNTYSSS